MEKTETIVTLFWYQPEKHRKDYNKYDKWSFPLETLLPDFSIPQSIQTTQNETPFNLDVILPDDRVTYRFVENGLIVIKLNHQPDSSRIVDRWDSWDLCKQSTPDKFCFHWITKDECLNLKSVLDNKYGFL